MISRNKWFVSGKITYISFLKGKTIISMKGKAYRKSIFSTSVVIDCIVSKELWESVLCLNLKPDRKITISGLLNLEPRNTYLIAERISII